MRAPQSGRASLARDRKLELELFQVAARSDLSAAAEERLTRLLSSTVWDYVLSAGGLHGVLPLLARHMEGREAVPDAVRQAMRERSERVARSNLHLSSQLIEIVDALERAGVPTLVLKGPAVAVTLYGDLFLREFGDLDILVKSADVTRATEVAQALGFAPWKATAGAQEELLQHVDYSRTFTRPDDDLDLDLHWDLARSFFRGRVEAEALWRDTGALDLHGRELRTLSPDLLLLSLCVHGAKHGPFPWPRLKWICDVAEFVRRADHLDWEAIIRRAGDLGCHRTLLFGLAVARPLLDGSLPPPIERELLKQPEVEQLASRVWGWLAAEGPVSLSFGQRAALDLALIDNASGRLSYVVRRVVTPTNKDLRSRILPRPFAFLYVPLRISRLAGQYLPRPWRLRRLLGQRRPESRGRSDS
jgi:hypothetical protein